MLYNPAASLRLPLFFNQAAGGNYVPFANAALNYRRDLVGTGSNGMYLSVTCAEDLPWVKPDEARRLAENTFLGDYRFRQQREACDLWVQAPLVNDYGKPVRSKVPVVIITGQWDPVTPPSNGEGAARHLSQGLHVIVPHAAHGLGGLVGTECIERLQNEFVSRGTVKGLDTSCVKAIRRKPWVLVLNQISFERWP